jgi:hypothetical protein
MIALILQLVIIALVLGLIIWLAEQIPFVAPFAHIIRVVAIVLFIIYLIYVLMGFLGHTPIVK